MDLLNYLKMPSISCFVESQWPNGGFGLLKAKTGCPGDFKSGWREGWRFQDMEDYGEHSRASLKNHMDISSDDDEGINRTFCMLNEINKKTIPWPIGEFVLAFLLKLRYF